MRTKIKGLMALFISFNLIGGWISFIASMFHNDIYHLLLGVSMIWMALEADRLINGP